MAAVQLFALFCALTDLLPHSHQRDSLELGVFARLAGEAQHQLGARDRDYVEETRLGTQQGNGRAEQLEESSC